MTDDDLSNLTEDQMMLIIKQLPIWEDLAAYGAVDLIVESEKQMYETAEALDGFHMPDLGPIVAQPFSEDGEYTVLLTLLEKPNLFSTLFGMVCRAKS